jgi:hypothetical protein
MTNEIPRLLTKGARADPWTGTAIKALRDERPEKKEPTGPRRLLPGDTPEAPTEMAAPATLDEAYTRWAEDPSKVNISNVLKAASRDIDHRIRSYGGTVSPLSRGYGKRIVLEALRSYEPNQRASFRTWSSQQLQRLSRKLRSSSNSVKIPEGRALDAKRIFEQTRLIEAETGYPPSMQDLSDKLSLSTKRVASILATQRPITYDDPELVLRDSPVDSMVNEWVYSSLAPKDQFIFESLSGYGDAAVIPSTQIAAKLKVTPAYISTRAQVIQDTINKARHSTAPM